MDSITSKHIKVVDEDFQVNYKRDKPLVYTCNTHVHVVSNLRVFFLMNNHEMLNSSEKKKINMR